MVTLFAHLAYETVVVDMSEYGQCFLFVAAGELAEGVIMVLLAREVYLFGNTALYALFVGESL